MDHRVPMVALTTYETVSLELFYIFDNFSQIISISFKRSKILSPEQENL